ncbi:DNA translocase FtsK [candidate division WWE3 bacterium CG08_land_8_20_14_0_20_40_13]|uniref:DNA translocase FtsK n=1 Tax=candidate division WWE3 bacterium CG08_land_8_20_14_0_20_40_13 TaxID=1975084 RepID=A0A2H0XEK0_UNCKA|nr:MAG: DNA translocase FtsK [candidate division WWE3 bacterium CG08_land_8_20_14_0_20_40_13]
MAKRGRKPKRRSLSFSLNTGALLSVVSLLFITASVISALSLIYSSRGVALTILSATLGETFGMAAFFIPPVLFYFGLFLFRGLKWRILETRVFLGLIVLFGSVVGIFGNYGGFVGQLASQKLSLYFSEVGAKVLFSLGLAVSLIIIFEFRLESIFANLGGVFGLVKNLARAVKSLKIPNFKTEKVGEELVGLNSSAKPIRELDFELVQGPSEPVEKEEKTRVKETLAKETPTAKTLTNIPYNDTVWEYPPLSILSDPPQIRADRGDVKQRALIIEKTLDSFGIRSKVTEVNKGPAVTQYALETAQGTKIAKITSLQNDIALALASPTGSVRIEAPIPGRSLIGVEVPNNSFELVTLKEIMLSEKVAKSKSKLMMALGKDVSGTSISYDIARMPHVLVAGSTGSGKSVMIHSIISTLLFRCSPQECKFILVDPKRVELVGYRDIPHLLTPVIVDSHKALPAFKWAISEMERRYRLLENAKVRDIDLYNEMSGFQALPYIIIIVDELADLMMTSANDVEKAICRIAQLARAVGIHLVLATQRPSVDVLTGLIKANIPCRIAFNVTSQIDSRVIIDQPGAEKLLGRGDMLFVPPDVSKPVRIQGVFVSDKEREALTGFLRQAPVQAEYTDIATVSLSDSGDGKSFDRGGSQDEFFSESVRLVVLYKKASSSLLQRKLSIGYARAARILDELETMGVVSGGDGSKPRDVLISDADKYLSQLNKSS